MAPPEKAGGHATTARVAVRIRKAVRSFIWPQLAGSSRMRTNRVLQSYAHDENDPASGLLHKPMFGILGTEKEIRRLPPTAGSALGISANYQVDSWNTTMSRNCFPTTVQIVFQK